MNYILPIIVFFFGLGLIILETMVPGLILGILGYILVIGAIVAAFDVTMVLGIILIITALLIIPYFVYRGFKRIRLNKTISETIQFDLEGLLEKTGVAVTDLRPVGKADIDGKQYEVYSDYHNIEAGQKVIIKKLMGNKILVHPLNDNDSA